MPLYVGDYISGTQRLTTEQHGAYLLLILDYWRNGPPPDDDDVLAQIVKMDRAKWRKARLTLVRLFKIENGEWRHKRIERELARVDAITEKRSAAAKVRWGKDKQSNGNANASANAPPMDMQNALQSQSQSQSQSQRVEEEGKEITSLLAFAGKTVRLNARDLDRWKARYHAIADLTAELGSLDDWLQAQDDRARKNWFQIVSGALNKKHQAALREIARDDDDACEFTGPC